MAHGIEKYKDWTGIYEGKASYFEEAAGDLWFRRHVIDDGKGKILASGPASALIPESQEEKPVFADRAGKFKYLEGEKNEKYY